MLPQFRRINGYQAWRMQVGEVQEGTRQSENMILHSVQFFLQVRNKVRIHAPPPGRQQLSNTEFPRPDQGG